MTGKWYGRVAIALTFGLMVSCASDPEPVATPPAVTPAVSTAGPTGASIPTDVSIPTGMTMPTDVTLDVSSYLSDAGQLASSLSEMTTAVVAPPAGQLTPAELTFVCGEPKTVWDSVDATLQDLNTEMEPTAEDYQPLVDQLAAVDVSSVQSLSTLWNNIRGNLVDRVAAIKTNMPAAKLADYITRQSNSQLALHGYFLTNCP